MQLTVHDAHLKKVAFIDNEKPKTLNFYDDTWTRNLQTGSSTYEFSISKKQLVSDTVLERTYNYLNERSFVSFEYKGKTYLFNVMTVEEDEKKIKCYCENLNLELINEYSNAYEADRAMTFVEYCNAMDLLNMTKLSIGINEISDYKRTLKWEGQDTKLARLISLANKFDAEIDFETFLNADSTIKSFLVNVYHENDGNFHGVGRVRKDITLVYGKNLKSIKRKIDKTGIFNMIVPSSQNEENSDQKLTIKDLPDWEIKNDAGVVEYFKKGAALYAPISAQLYPSTFTSETQSDQWIRHDMEFDVKSAKQLETEGLKQLKASAYPELTYEFDGYINADIGDTVQISDSGFTNMLLLEARIFEQKLSFSSEKNWKTTLGNFKALQNMLSSDIQAELEKLVDNAKPYIIRVSSDNGIAFKNGEGESTIKATLWKGNKVLDTDVTWRWALDGNVTVGMQYLARGSAIKDTAVLTVSAYVGNNEVATTEITLTNVNDGVDGAKGDKGEKGEKGDKGDTGERGPQGIQGLQGPKGNQGIQGEKGADGKTQYTHIAYADNATGGGFSQTDQTKTYIGMYQDFTATDSNDPTKYRWTKWKGSDGAQGIPGKAGADGKTPYIHFAYADDDKGTNFSLTDKNQQYQGYYSDYTEADSTDYKKYTWVDRLANVQIDQLNLIGAFNLTPQNATFDKTDYTLISTTTTNTKNGFVQLQFFDAKNVVFTSLNLSEKVGKFAKSFKITKAYERFRIKFNGNKSDACVWCYDKDLIKLNTDYVLSGEVLSLSADGRGNGGKIRYLKIQEGKVATGFSKSPKDVDSDISKVTSEFKQTTDSIKASVSSLDKSTVKTSTLNLDNNGFVTKVDKVVDGNKFATMIAQDAENVKIIADKMQVNADMIVDGAVTADKLNVDNLSAVNSDLGEIKGGSLLLQEKKAAGSNIDNWGTYNFPAYKQGLYMDSSAIASSGAIKRKNGSETTPTDMPLAVLGSGELRFLAVDYNENLKNIVHHGLSDPDFGAIRFEIDSELKRRLTMFTSGYLNFHATNYTDWQSTGVAGCEYMIQGRLVIVNYDVTFNSTGTHAIGGIPQEFTKKTLMMTAKARSILPNGDRNIQLNPDGSMHILNAEANVNYRGTLVFSY